ncbi:MAG TPA: response regulator [Gemmatimonadaceae bacterium]|nr:response regulator [Gemmatimonadaceae bacterium]
MPKPLRLLIAEDSEDDALLLVRNLRQADYAVSFERVAAPAALRDAITREHWDLVISDYNMPGFGGLDALAIVRAHDRDVPFVFVSGSIGEDVAVAAMRAGAQDYVMKNNMQRLAPAIERELTDSKLRRDSHVAEQRLRATTEVLHAMFTASPLAIIITGLDGHVQLWNPAAQRLFGWSEQEVLGVPLPTIPDDASEEAIELRAQRLQPGPVGGRDVKRRRRDGFLIDVNVSAAVIRDGAGSPNRVLVLVQDIRDRKRLEAQFLQAQKMEAVGQLAGGIAHDFNNLLTVITSYSDFLLADLPHEDPKREEVTQIRSAADAATALSRQLLVFSRNQVLQPQVVSLNDIVSGSHKLLKRLIGADIELVLSLDKELGLVEADPGQVEQVVMNLSINARDAMPSGGKVVVETRNTFDATTNSPCVTLAVSDNGVGMDASTQARIFEPFFTTKDPGKGTGLGLATVYSIVNQYDGTIHVYSEPGVGTTFKIHLPRIDSPVPAPPQPQDSPEALHGTECVLIVEDAAAVRAVTRQVLERFGYAVIEAPDGPTALRLAAKVHGAIDLLLTDVVMPGMSGRLLAEQFRAARPNAKVLFASGYTDDAILHHGVLELGMPYIQKPFTPEALARKVRDTLRSA